jgi:hypothetical protein
MVCVGAHILDLWRGRGIRQWMGLMGRLSQGSGNFRLLGSRTWRLFVGEDLKQNSHAVACVRSLSLLHSCESR